MQMAALAPSAAAPQQLRGARAQATKPAAAAMRLRAPTLDAPALPCARAVTAAAVPRARARRHRCAATSGADGKDDESHGGAAKPPASMGSPERRNVDRSEWLEAEAYGEVSTYASRAPLAACFPNTPLQDILPHFEEFTGLPVLDAETHKPLGMVRVPARMCLAYAAATDVPAVCSLPRWQVSEKDVMAYLQQYGDDTSHLSTPVKCVAAAHARTGAF
jgi:hypothetical protein